MKKKYLNSVIDSICCLRGKFYTLWKSRRRFNGKLSLTSDLVYVLEWETQGLVSWAGWWIDLIQSIQEGLSGDALLVLAFLHFPLLEPGHVGRIPPTCCHHAIQRLARKVRCLGCNRSSWCTGKPLCGFPWIGPVTKLWSGIKTKFISWFINKDCQFIVFWSTKHVQRCLHLASSFALCQHWRRHKCKEWVWTYSPRYRTCFRHHKGNVKSLHQRRRYV